MSNPNHITRQQLAALIGNKSPSYINELAKTGRAFKAPDGKHWLKDESLSAYRAGRDPSKQGVANRHAAARAGQGEAAAPNDAGSGARAKEPPNAEAIGSNYQHARAVKEKFLALEAKRAYEVNIGTLRDAREVERLVISAMTEVRQRLENLAVSIAPIVAAQSNEIEVRSTLRDAFEHALQSASQHFDKLQPTETET